MVHVAKEMQRLGYKQPLLIGGATTSPAHTAVKIDPQYEGAVIYVKDASRSVGVCQQLVTADTRDAYVANIKAERAAARAASQQERQGAAAARSSRRAREIQDRLGGVYAARPSFLGVRAFDDYPLAELVPYIDWMPFFNAWEFAGKFPDILQRPGGRRGGEQPVCRCHAHARQLIEEKWLRGARRGGLLSRPTATATMTSRCSPTTRAADRERQLHHLRQQKSKPQNQAQLLPGGFRRARWRAAGPIISAPSP
jgi:5-methyltetrahydrofolate--homocysteine methyltransferase